MFVDEKAVGEKQPVKTGMLKLSEAVRANGYERFSDPNECVLGRAFRAVAGMSVNEAADQSNPKICGGNYPQAVSNLYGVPLRVCLEAEQMCLHRRTPSMIADWLESKGF